jgi:hypothetical protein
MSSLLLAAGQRRWNLRVPPCLQGLTENLLYASGAAIRKFEVSTWPCISLTACNPVREQRDHTHSLDSLSSNI